MKITDTHVYFWGGNFSNWHPVTFTDNINGIMEWKNTEQAFMYYKARFFGDETIARKICYHPDPKEVKALGRQVSGYNDLYWSFVRFGYMVYVNYLKFSQNSELKNELLSTDNRILVEASPYDRIWGVKLAQDDPLILDENNWRGQNLLGKALMEVRNKLK